MSSPLTAISKFLARRMTAPSSRRRRRKRHPLAARKPLFQLLERRTVLDAVAWAGPASGGDWDVAAHWLDSTTGANRVPGGGDNVTIDTGGTTATVTLQSGDNVSIASLTTDNNATLSIVGGAQLTISGDFVQASGSALDFSLNGPRAGLDYGVLDVQGSAALAGTIDVALAAGYTPGPDDTYQPLLFGSATGTSTVNNPAGETDVLTPTSLYVAPAGSTTLTVTNTADSGSGSLRDAITAANASLSPVSLLTFDIPTSDPGYGAANGVWTVSPLSALPTVTAHAIIDATTQPSFVGKPVVQLDGANAGSSNINGLNLNGGYSRVTGLAIDGFSGDGIELSGGGFDTLAGNAVGADPSGNLALANMGTGIFVNNVADNAIGGMTPGTGNVISGNGANGILIDGIGASANAVEGDFIGTNAAGTAALGNSAWGVVVRGAATNNIIGGAIGGTSNVISGNGKEGIWIGDAGTSDNAVEGNFIGTDAAGTAALGNNGNGVAIQNGATNNTVGGAAAGMGNVISGNVFSGVSIAGAGTSANLLEGNRIGCDGSGSTALPNNGNGVQIVGGATKNTIGGAALGAGNVVSGNGAPAAGYAGVFISGTGTSENLVAGNRIGTNATGDVALGNNGSGVVIRGAATNNTIGGAANGAPNTISGNSQAGVWIGDDGTSHNAVEGNFIGTDATGNAGLGNGGYGVAIQSGATNNTIGGAAAGEGNVISGNGTPANGNGGVFIGGTGTSENLVAGNRIGTNATGNVALGNNGSGVVIRGSATNNTIGGAAIGAPNTISGNSQAGVWIGDDGTSHNAVEGNFIGTDATGNAGLGNGGYGVAIQSGATNNTIGGAAAGEGNVISGNGTPANGNGGVFIGGTGTSGNFVAANYMGTNATGNVALGNSGWGVVISGAATNNAIGDAAPGASNVISGNGDGGLWIGGAGTSHNTVEGNFIGTDAAGNSALGNGQHGVAIRNGATNNTVGGAVPGAGNTIAFNKIDGVLVDTGTQNLISQNSIFSNGHLGIELSNNGNNNQAAPTLESASGNNTSTVVGSLSGAPDTTFTLEFFANSAGNPVGSVEGQTFVGSESVTTNASGSADFSVKLPVALPANQPVVTATATDANLNTSSFSNGVSATATPFKLTDDVYVVGAGPITVTAANGLLQNDAGPTQLSVVAATVTGAEGGTFVFHTDGSFTYTPPANFPGFDYARYEAKDSAGAQGTATVNVLSQTGGVVWKFYEQVLDRDPDYAGLQGWIEDFLHGGMPGDIAAGFFESTELLDRIISGFYQQYLSRTPQGNDLDFWDRAWRAAGGPETIKAQFADSPEFNALAGNAGGTDPGGWVTALYQRILNRSPQGDDLPFWKQQLADGVSEYQVALDFFTSPEADDNDVSGWFNEYLGRAPTPAELAQYANQMLGGANDRDIEQAITNLPEYSANPPASPAGTGVRLPDYLPPAGSAKNQAVDAFFATL